MTDTEPPLVRESPCECGERPVLRNGFYICMNAGCEGYGQVCSAAPCGGCDHHAHEPGRCEAMIATGHRPATRCECGDESSVAETVTPEHLSDEYHPVLGFDGEASDTLTNIIGSMRGFGVTLTLEDDSQVEAVLAGITYDAASERMLTAFYRVVDGDFPDIDDVPASQVERLFAKRIQVS